MRRHAALLALVAVLASARLADAQAPPRPADERELVARIRARLDAYARADAEAWAAYVADDCICGLESKDTIRQAITLRPPTVKLWYGELTDLRVRPIVDGAVVRYRVRENSDVGGQQSSHEQWRTETYTHQTGAWILVAGAETLIPPDPKAVAVDAALLARYVGRYQYAEGAVDDVTLVDGKLYVQPSNEGRVELLAEDDTTFFAAGEAWRLVFLRDGSGAVTGVAFRQQGQEWQARRLP